MGKMVVVKGDAVSGTDKHTVSGVVPNPPPPGTTVPCTGTGSYTYNGAITSGLSTFVKIGGIPAALETSKSSLNPTETGPSGGHFALTGKNLALTPPGVPPNTPLSLAFMPAIVGVGVPNAASGSALLTVGGVKVLLDGDKMDTCDNTLSANSTVTASGQSFVSCSA